MEAAKNIPAIDRTISATDGMFAGNETHYFGVGASALLNINHALAIAGPKPSRILDFGCGAGRVTRWLAVAYGDAEIEGCDTRPADVDFVAKQFGVTTWISGDDVEALNAPSTYDLIWVGSVFTHLSENNSIRLFDKFVSWLNPGGALVLTSHGRYPASIGPQMDYYGIPEQWPRVKSDFERSVFGYADYQATPGYGISLVPLQWWAKLATSRTNVRLVAMTERAWDDHQDVISVQKTL